MTHTVPNESYPDYLKGAFIQYIKFYQYKNDVTYLSGRRPGSKILDDFL